MAGLARSAVDGSGVGSIGIWLNDALLEFALTVVLPVELETAGGGLSAGLASPHPDECDEQQDGEHAHHDGKRHHVLGLHRASVAGGCGARRSAAELVEGLRLALRDDVRCAGDEGLRPCAVVVGDAGGHGGGGADLLAAGGGIGVP